MPTGSRDPTEQLPARAPKHAPRRGGLVRALVALVAVALLGTGAIVAAGIVSMPRPSLPQVGASPSPLPSLSPIATSRAAGTSAPTTATRTTAPTVVPATAAPTAASATPAATPAPTKAP